MRAVRWMRAHKITTFFLLLAAFVLFEIATIPWFSVASLKTANPGQTALMRQRIAEAEKEGKTLKIVHSWIPLSRIPRYVIDAVVVAEDGTFWSHNGFDWYEVRESVEKNIEKRRAARGASTITQQLAKNLYLSTSKDPLRKGKEAIITILLEHQLDKNRILELYLNSIEWGRGVFGIDAASRTYFGKPASDLTVDEGARLAAVIPSPLRHRPDSESKYVLYRTKIVLTRMAARKALPQSQPEEVSSSQTEPEPAEYDETDSTATDEGSNNGL
jgi:monofunctional glycosyltransferase